jgi:hypothetical protein
MGIGEVGMDEKVMASRPRTLDERILVSRPNRDGDDAAIDAELIGRVGAR